MRRSLKVVLIVLISGLAILLADEWAERAKEAVHFLRYHPIGFGGPFQYLKELTTPLAMVVSICAVEAFLEWLHTPRVVLFALVASIIVAGWVGGGLCDKEPQTTSAAWTRSRADSDNGFGVRRAIARPVEQ